MASLDFKTSSMSSLSCSISSLTSEETKESIDQPADVIFLQKINENHEMLQVLEKIKEHFGKRIENLAYPFIIERIVQRSFVCNRSSDIIGITEKYLQRYKDYELDTILNKQIINETKLMETWPMFIYGHSKQGHPICYDQIASTDFANLFKTFTACITHDHDDQEDEKYVEKVIHLLSSFRFKFLAKLSQCTQDQSNKYNTTIFRHIWIVDLKDFSYKNVACNISNFIKLAKPVVENEQTTFPENAYKTYLINCPWSFKFIWKIMSVWFDSVIQEKIKMLGSDYLDEMLKEIDISQIPQKYGGTGKWDIQHI